MKINKTVVKQSNTPYNRLIKVTMESEEEGDESGEIGFTVEGLDSRGNAYHFDFDEDELEKANKLFNVLNP